MMAQQLVARPNDSNAIPEPAAKLQISLSRSRLALLLAVFGLGGMLALVPIAGAVIAIGEVTTASRPKMIAHPTGGVIAEIPISNGTRVKAGTLLMRLDSNVSAAGAAMTSQSIDQLIAREARLRAERDGAGHIAFPAILTASLAGPRATQAIDEERRIFDLNREALAGQRSMLEQQIRQAETAISSYRDQARVYREQEVLILEERDANERLWEKRFTTLQRRNELQRAAIGIRGSVASTQASGAQMTAKIAELRERIFAINGEARRQAGAELAEIQLRLTELRQNNIVATDTNNRNSIRAPYDGIVDKLSFTTIGGVVPAGETIMEIIPDRDAMIVAARVNPADIDQLQHDQPVSLRFSAFNQQTTPQIEGRLSKIGADRSIDPTNGFAYYPVEVRIGKAELERLGQLKLRPGMPVEAFIKTGNRTLLGYLTKPLSDQIVRAFR
jgi:HlyD family secretion protein